MGIVTLKEYELYVICKPKENPIGVIRLPFRETVKMPYLIKAYNYEANKEWLNPILRSYKYDKLWNIILNLNDEANKPIGNISDYILPNQLYIPTMENSMIQNMINFNYANDMMLKIEEDEKSIMAKIKEWLDNHNH